jgi:hypothetical protein
VPGMTRMRRGALIAQAPWRGMPDSGGAARAKAEAAFDDG